MLNVEAVSWQKSPIDSTANNSIGAEHLRAELEDSYNQYFQLHEKFDRLLELYGGCLETIEELKHDNDDLRKLCREQVKYFCKRVVILANVKNNLHLKNINLFLKNLKKNIKFFLILLIFIAAK